MKQVVLVVFITLAVGIGAFASAGDSKDALQTKVLLKHQDRIRRLELRVTELERLTALHAKVIGNMTVKVVGGR